MNVLSSNIADSSFGHVGGVFPPLPLFYFIIVLEGRGDMNLKLMFRAFTKLWLIKYLWIHRYPVWVNLVVFKTKPTFDVGNWAGFKKLAKNLDQYKMVWWNICMQNLWKQVFVTILHSNIGMGSRVWRLCSCKTNEDVSENSNVMHQPAELVANKLVRWITNGIESFSKRACASWIELC